MKSRQITRRARVRLKLKAVSDRPRLVLRRSSRHIWAQVIDLKGKVLATGSSKILKEKLTKTESARAVGVAIGEVLVGNKLKKIVFDRSGYRYHGRVKALAEGARQAGLEF